MIICTRLEITFNLNCLISKKINKVFATDYLKTKVYFLVIGKQVIVLKFKFCLFLCCYLPSFSHTFLALSLFFSAFPGISNHLSSSLQRLWPLTNSLSYSPSLFLSPSLSRHLLFSFVFSRPNQFRKRIIFLIEN